ncbi:MAG TPA: hypothetical protein DEO92_06165 [Phycisphaerales bacterium]|jgi:hypothetical protein|nr:hypothetical protein [Phycisphaerales bacterium]
MKLFKRIALIVVLVVIVAVIGVYVGIDMIARNVVDSQGTAIFGVPTNVSSVRLAVFSNGSKIQDLTIANPSGFKEPNFIKVDDARIEANLGTLLSSDIQIPLVHVTGLTVDLEQIDDRMNASIIVKNVSDNTSTPDDTDDPMKVNVQRLVIENIHLTASGSIVNIAGGHLDTKIPRLELSNLGTETDGDQLSHHLVSILLGVLMKHIAENPIQGLSGVAVGSVVTAIENIPLVGQTGAAKSVGGLLKGVTGGLNKGVGGIGKGIEDLLGGGDKKKEGDEPKGDD